MHDELDGWEVFGKIVVDGVTYLEVGDPAECGNELPTPGCWGYCAVLDNDALRFVGAGSDEFFRVMDAFTSQR